MDPSTVNSRQLLVASQDFDTKMNAFNNLSADSSDDIRSACILELEASRLRLNDAVNKSKLHK